MSWSPFSGNPVAEHRLAPVPEGVELTVPELGPSVDSATIVAWAKKVGDRVAADEPICRLAVNELQFEVHSTAEGEVTRILAERGETVQSGDSLAEIRAQTAEREPAAVVDSLPPPPDPEPPPSDVEPESPALEIEPEPPAMEVEPQPAAYEPERPPAELDPEPTPEEPEPEPDIHERTPPFYVTEPPLETEGPGAAEAEPLGAGEAQEPDAQPDPAAWPPPSDVDWSRWHSPVVRLLAEQRDLDLSQVDGTGIDGRIRKRDVLAHAEGLPHS